MPSPRKKPLLKRGKHLKQARKARSYGGATADQRAVDRHPRPLAVVLVRGPGGRGGGSRGRLCGAGSAVAPAFSFLLQMLAALQQRLVTGAWHATY